MEQFIKDFGDHTDEPTKIMLQNVYNHKKKFDKFKQKLILCTWGSLGSFLLLFFYMNYFIIKPNAASAEKIFLVIVQDGFLFFLIGILIFLSGLGTYYKKKKDKHEKEYQELRKEIVSKAPLQWRYPFDWEKRNEVFSKMKEMKDINLYHENK
ncbi:DUF2663 family protein [Bacillus sp. BGMRC 2118]|nr:DUF2663 family protein [Bacillus sp. BGMRC 2118]